MRIYALIGVLALAVVGTAAAQGPLYDRVTFDLPYRVHIQDRVLPPGQYVIQEHKSPAKTGVLLIYSDDGMEFETSVQTIDTLDQRTPENTKVVLHRIGDDYYFDKLWIQGKNYGYEFVLPENVRSRQREMQAVDVAGRYERTDRPMRGSAARTDLQRQKGTTTETWTETQQRSSSTQHLPADSRQQVTRTEQTTRHESHLKREKSSTGTAEVPRAQANRVIPGSDRTQERIVRQVRHELVMLPYYGVFDNFEYRVDGNTVTLMGQVTRPTLKSSAERVVKDVEGVERVINNIEVLPVSPEDDRIRMDMFRAIYGHTALNRYALQAVPPIHIIVRNGNVTLEGVVANESDRNIANMQARSVPGVFNVTNNLRVEQR